MTPIHITRATTVFLNHLNIIITKLKMARQRRGMEMGVLLLLGQVFNAGIQNVPLVTLSVIAGQVISNSNQ